MNGLNRFWMDLLSPWQPFWFRGWLVGYAVVDSPTGSRMLWVGRKYARKRRG